jgi:hypothetical protein
VEEGSGIRLYRGCPGYIVRIVRGRNELPVVLLLESNVKKSGTIYTESQLHGGPPILGRIVTFQQE